MKWHEMDGVVCQARWEWWGVRIGTQASPDAQTHRGRAQRHMRHARLLCVYVCVGACVCFVCVWCAFGGVCVGCLEVCGVGGCVGLSVGGGFRGGGVGIGALVFAWGRWPMSGLCVSWARGCV